MACERRGKWIGGCRFEPRYDTTPMLSEVFALPSQLPSIIEASKRKTYVGDVCVRCGTAIVRETVEKSTV